MLHPIIMAGGYGARLWPLSRELHPKQFIPLVKEGVSMLQDTCQRLDGIEAAQPLLICNEQHRFLAAEQLRQLGMDSCQIILEPAGRNTAPALALAALESLSKDEDAVLLALAADHLILDIERFHESVNTAFTAAMMDKLVVFGVTPTHPETGYGYIKRGVESSVGAFAVDSFVEKPCLERAEEYLKDGSYYWNSGMFMFKAKKYLEELERQRPAIVAVCRQALAAGKQDMHFTRVDPELFLTCPDESVDYAVMEGTEDGLMVSLDAGWCDVGSWNALWDVGDKNSDGNVLKGDVLTSRTRDCYVHSDYRLVTTLGVSNLVIVETKDAVLVAEKSSAQDIKAIVSLIKAEGRSEYMRHREVYRPWGMYDCIDAGRRYQVKRITVNPGAKLSVQMHHHRAEHWIVVSGTAQVTNGEKTYLVTENQSTYIPIGQVHALENPGVIPLELIEVQSGSYLGEDDIVRFEDKYGRI
ncbi:MULTISPECIES: mannose-1-phosphate guanylyltransferase/mannose-6-phosphate isomerase [unclassified Pseudomonas]|uniref:mannose-1-phosphate guanylyltransferase/mannose-6-phosphate isomerase n=1 Tax=unclassified Pseudomonas TaxID=196821 RepID=UPI0021BA53E4|nr:MULTISPECIES: mannose-1-phosphate guanylyltransferase/mannose-6-phosphate isomerase [unclassified Pseudomonas]MCT8166646.1 mannose-1-phosphate guanylyltransferase/mannose-6-phosphate isomerase [Pseudomonas sp. HD6422]MCT8185542.1 mannose-1-phosphate guanylyltransferase/mannose-6-phosphate isomerase [Pseudomonas sp. HD6421]